MSNIAHTIKNEAKRRLKAGFTLVELLVSISIMVLIMSIILINYHRFDNTFSVTNLAYDIALSIRQAQSYGISVHANTQVGNNIQNAEYQFGYGIHFWMPNTGSPTPPNNQYILFADSNSHGTQDYYDGDTACSSGTECLQKYTLTSGYTISSICYYTNPNSLPWSCLSPGGTLDITFVRPDPDAIICPYTSGTVGSFAGISSGSCSSLSGYTAVVTVASPDSTVLTHTITIQPTGQISVN